MLSKELTPCRSFQRGKNPMAFASPSRELPQHAWQFVGDKLAPYAELPS